ncbi:MAG: SufE family protein [Planctomycetota bacterium]|nr:SufE family protein [Planctomycetota bacterium]
MSAAIPSIDSLVEKFQFIEDWEDRYTYLIELGRKLEPMADSDMTSEAIVKGCQATVYLKASLSKDEPPIMSFIATANAAIVSGLIAILQSIYGGRTPQEIIDIDALSLVGQMGFEDHLSITRKNGLHAMITRIKFIAAEYVSTV